MQNNSRTICAVEAIYIRVPRAPKLHMGRQLEANKQGYIVDPDNGTIYPADDRTLVLKITCDDGTVGWGETYGIVAAGVVKALIEDIVEPFLIGKDPLDVRRIWESLYNMMRVRGYTSGFWLDTLAAVDIGLWDLCGKILKQPIHKLLGGKVLNSIPAYITSIGGTTIDQQLENVAQLYNKGFKAFKVHAATSFDCVDLINLMRMRYPDIEIMLDLHWCFTSAEAISIAKRLEKCRISFIEAPCHTEDIEGLAKVSIGTSIPIAAGEEWRTVYEAHARLKNSSLGVIQPEMGRTGITQFIRICQLADIYHVRVAPHATIGFGIFMAASLHASSSIEMLNTHEFQNNFMGQHLHHFETTMSCSDGKYKIPDGYGLGIEPKESLWKFTVN